jgi:uracil-DNA glycosylase family 4
MRALPIYREPPRVPLQDAEPRTLDTGCELCDLHAGTKPGARCVGAEGEPGGLLVVDSVATKAEVGARRPFAGQSSVLLRQLLRKHWTGPVALDLALRCAPPAGTKVEKLIKPIAACRGYLHGTVDEVRPTRIIAVGAHAIFSVTGRRLPPFEVRRGFAWLHLDHGPVPVFFVCSPLAAARNRFVRQWFEDDLEWALTAEPPVGPHRIGEAAAYLVENPGQAAYATAYMRAARWAAVDCEWAGRPYDRDHRMLSVSLTAAPALRADGTPDLNDPAADFGLVWTRPGLEDPATLAPLLAYLRDPEALKVGSYIKADLVGIHSAWKVWTRGVHLDIRLARRAMDTEASGELEDIAERVGRGGMKAELEDALTDVVARLRRESTKLKGELPPNLPPNLRPEHARKLIGEWGPDPKKPGKFTLVGAAPKKRYGYAAVDPELLYRYNAGDTVVTAKAGALLEHELTTRSAGLQNVFRKVIMPSGDAFARVEAWGVAADRRAIKAFGDFLTLKLNEVRTRLDAKVGADFNPDNQHHVRALLFDPKPEGLGLTPVQETGTGLASTDADTLEALVDEHPVVADILQWRQVAKMKSTYADGSDGDGGLLAHVRDDGRIHPTIHPDGADTGRTSSSAPNLQNIPSTENPDEQAKALAVMIRNCFTATPSTSGLPWWLVEFDYSQIELRVAADQSGDPGMLGIFQRGEDYHRRTAQMLSRELWNIAPEAVTDDHRREIKPVNFQFLYDDDPYSIAFTLTLKTGKRWSPKRVAVIKDAVFGAFPLLAKFIKDRVKYSNTTGLSHTWWEGMDARERLLWRIADHDEYAAKTARRGAWNGPIQGTANEYLVSSMTESVDWVVDNGIPAKVVLTVHDSMLWDVRQDALIEVVTEVPRIMANKPTKNGVPLVADFKYGPAWGSMKKGNLDAIRALVTR